jgi:TPR repeat protein
MLESGHGVPANEIAAIRFYREAADAGHPSAQYRFGLASLTGDGIDKFCPRAAPYLRKAMEKGHLEAKYICMAQCLQKGWVWTETFSAAVAIFKEVAEAGNPKAMVDYGFACLAGRGTPRDFFSAARWLRAAVDKGEKRAIALYVNLVSAGEGVAQNLTEAPRFFKDAPDDGNARCQVECGVVCYRGQGVPKNLTEAIHYLKLAVEPGRSVGLLVSGAGLGGAW